MQRFINREDIAQFIQIVNGKSLRTIPTPDIQLGLNSNRPHYGWKKSTIIHWDSNKPKYQKHKKLIATIPPDKYYLTDALKIFSLQTWVIQIQPQIKNQKYGIVKYDNKTMFIYETHLPKIHTSQTSISTPSGIIALSPVYIKNSIELSSQEKLKIYQTQKYLLTNQLQILLEEKWY